MSEIKVVSFKIGDEEYALDIMKIDSIIEVKNVMKIPQSLPFIEGVMDFRGTVIPVINGRKKLELPGESKSNKAIVVNMRGKKIAMLVDEVKEVLTFAQKELEEPPQEITSVNNKYISAIANINGRMIIVLDADKILSESENAVVSQMMKDNVPSN